MKKFMRQFRYGQGGFTLIELLVVIAILGVLAAVAIPNVGTFMGRGKTQAAETELHNVQTATMAAMADAEVGTITAGDRPSNGNSFRHGELLGFTLAHERPSLVVPRARSQISTTQLVEWRERAEEPETGS